MALSDYQSPTVRPMPNEDVVPDVVKKPKTAGQLPLGPITSGVGPGILPPQTPQTPQTPSGAPMLGTPMGPVAPGVLPARTSGTQLTPYTATNNLRGTQITGSGQARTISPYDNRTTQAGGYVSQSANNVNSNAANQTRAMALKDLQGLNGPDRGQLAESTFKRLRESTEPQFQKELQGVGQKAAALGRLGAGMTTSDLGDVVQRREQALTYEAGRLADEAAGKTLDDRLSTTDARLRGSGQFTSEDLGRSDAYRGLSDLTYGQGQGLRNEERLDDDRTFARDTQQRDELRGERDFQNNMSKEAFDQMVRQRSLEEMLLSGEFGRDMDMNQLLLSYGYGG